MGAGGAGKEGSWEEAQERKRFSRKCPCISCGVTPMLTPFPPLGASALGWT